MCYLCVALCVRLHFLILTIYLKERGSERDKGVSGSFRGSSESRAHRHGLLVPFVQRLRCVLVAFCRMFCRLSGGICVKSRVIHVKGAAGRSAVDENREPGASILRRAVETRGSGGRVTRWVVRWVVRWAVLWLVGWFLVGGSLVG